MSGSGRQLLGRGSIYTLATAAPMLAALAITPALTRALSQTQYGLASVGVTVLQFTFNLLAMGLPTAITRHSIINDSGPAGARGIAARGAMIAMGLSVVCCLVAWLLLSSGQEARPAISLGVLAGGAGSGIAMAQALSLAEDRPWHYVGLAFGMSLLAPATGLLAVALTTGGSGTYLTALCAVYMLVNGFAYWQVARSGEVYWRWTEFRAAMSVALPMIPHQLAIGTTTAAAVWIAAARMGVGAAAEAQPSIQLGTMPLVVTSALSYAWTPLVLRAAPVARATLLEETASVVTWLAAMGGGIVALLAPWVLRLLTPYELANMVPLTAMTALTAAIAAGYLAHLQLVVAEGATRMLAVLSPLALLVGAGCSWILSGYFGLAGLGAGYLTTYVLLLLFTRAIARRASTVRWNDSRLLIPLAVGASLCLIGGLLGWTSTTTMVIRIGLGCAGAVIALRLFMSQLRSAPRPVEDAEDDSLTRRTKGG